jgi:Putative Ig domain
MQLPIRRAVIAAVIVFTSLGVATPSVAAELTAPATGPTIEGTPPVARPGQPYEYQFTVTGGEGLKLGAASLPDWLDLDYTTGRVYGTAPAGDVHGNQYTFSIIARDNIGYDRETFTIPVDMWGPNHDGWNITIDNQTGTAFEWAYMHSYNIFHTPETIPARTTVTDTRGRQSWFGGPANLTLNYFEVDSQSRVHLSIESWDDGYIRATCNSGSGIVCAVDRAVSWEPIKVTIRN